MTKRELLELLKDYDDDLPIHVETTHAIEPIEDVTYFTGSNECYLVLHTIYPVGDGTEPTIDGTEEDDEEDVVLECPNCGERL